MNTQKCNTRRAVSVVVIGLIAGVLSFDAIAGEETANESSPQLIYQTRSINHSIFSYLGNKLAEVAVDPKIIYVSQANGQAIHSYTHSGDEKVAPWNVEYVNTAYNPAIYSYEGPRAKGKVKLLPATSMRLGMN